MISTPSHPPAIKIEILLWVIVTLIAILLRLPALGDPPLNDHEAASALASMAGDDMTFSGLESPLVAVLNAGIFAVTGGTDASARLLPALSGVLLAISPLLFKKRLNSLTALFAASWLAVSPSLVAASRQVAGQSIAALCAVILLALLLDDLVHRRGGKAILIGVVTAVGFLSDDGFGRVLIALAAAYVFMRFTGDSGAAAKINLRESLHLIPWGVAGLAFAAASFLLSTGFLAFPAGLSAIGEQLAAAVSGFWREDPAATMPIFSLLAYEAFLLVLGLIAVGRFASASSPCSRFLAGWAGASLMIALLARSGAALDSVYVVLPVALLAAHLVVSMAAEGVDLPAGPVFAAGILALFAMIANNINIFQSGQASAVFGAAALPGDLPLELILAGLWAALLIVITATVWLNRGSVTALQGFTLAWLVCSLVFGLGESVSIAFTRPGDPGNLLRPAPAQPSLALLIDEINEINEIANGSQQDAAIVVEAKPEGALAWALRRFPSVTYVDHISQVESSEILITPASHADIITSSIYVGQPFDVTAGWSPVNVTVPQVISWLFSGRTATGAIPDSVILWVKDDIYLLQNNTIR